MKRQFIAGDGASIYLFAICAGSIVSAFLSLILSKSAVYFDGMSLFNWLGYALMQVAFIAVIAAYIAVRKVHAPSFLRTARPKKLVQLAITPFLAISTILTFLPLANLWASFLDVIGYVGGGAAMPNYSNPGVYFLSLLLMAIIPAVCEELLMRGAVFSSLSTKNLWFGALISAALFSLMHQNPLQTVHQFGLGIVLALAVACTGSVWTAVLIHFFNNFISITSQAYMPFIDAAYIKLGYYNWLVGGVSVIVGLLLTITLLYVMFRLGGKTNAQNCIRYDNFTIYIPDDMAEQYKQSPIRQYFGFIKSLFKKDGYKNITVSLSDRNAVPAIGGQRLWGVWLALGLAAIYWLYVFIRGLL